MLQDSINLAKLLTIEGYKFLLFLSLIYAKQALQRVTKLTTYVVNSVHWTTQGLYNIASIACIF